MGHRCTILIGLGLCLAWTSAAVAQVRVYAQVEIPGEIYPGERFQYSLVVENAGAPSDINTAPLARFDPGPPTQQRSTQMINFQTRSSFTTSYALTAPAPGPVRIEPLTLVVDGVSYTTNAVEFTVARPGTTDKLHLSCSLSEATCYVGQPVVLDVVWTVLAQVQDASFDVPILRSDAFEFEDPVRPGGAQGQTHAIHGVPVEIFQKRSRSQGVEAVTLSFQKVLIPRRAGALHFEPASVSTRLAVGRVRVNDFFQPYRTQYKRFSVSAEALDLQVQPLPTAGRPAGFTGLVGDYRIETEATPTTVSVGDPITLTIRIGGNPYLKPVAWPALEQVPDLVRDFRIPTEKASPVLENGAKVFTQTIRAKHDGVTQIPPLPLATFDPASGTYRTVSSEAIPLTVAASQVLDSGDLVGVHREPVNREVEAIREGLAANDESDAALIPQDPSLVALVLRPAPLALWVLPLLSLLTSVGWKTARHRSPAQIAARRRRQAAGRALRGIQALRTLPPGERALPLAQILRRFVGDRFDRTGAALTAEECGTIAGHTEAAQALRAILATCDAAQYAGAAGAIPDEDLARARDLVQTLDREARSR